MVAEALAVIRVSSDELADTSELADGEFALVGAERLVNCSSDLNCEDEMLDIYGACLECAWHWMLPKVAGAQRTPLGDNVGAMSGDCKGESGELGAAWCRRERRIRARECVSVRGCPRLS